MIEIDISKCPKDPPVKIFYPDGSLLTETDNVIMFNYIRSEIAKNKWEGFTAKSEDGIIYDIQSNGRILYSPGKPIIFDTFTSVIARLIHYGKQE